MKINRLLVLLMSLWCIFAIKPRYGGEIEIYLNEPYSFNYVNDDYSSTIFYSLIYENFFFLSPEGDVTSHLFTHHLYDQDRNTLQIILNDHLSFSDGSPVTAGSVSYSLNEFIKLETSDSKALSRVLQGIQIDDDTITLVLNFEYPQIIDLLTSPQLVLISPEPGVFSGPFMPSEWIKGEHIILAANPYYPGGRSYLDSVRVLFEIGAKYPDVFLSTLPEVGKSFQKMDCGIYENTYLIFPDSNTPLNNRQAVYSLMKDFGKSESLKPLEVLTSEEESPVIIDIEEISLRQARQRVMYSRLNLYFFPSFKEYQERFVRYLENRNITLKTFFLDSRMKGASIRTENLDYIILQKSFQKATPLKEKISRIVSELLFSRYDETYRLRVKELDELAALKENELLMDRIASLITDIVDQGIIYPLFQKDYYLYYRKNLAGIQMDYYGRPLFSELRYGKKEQTDD